MSMTFALLGFLLAAEPRDPPFSDILEAPRELLDLIEQHMWQLAEDAELREQVVDFVIVGSYAYGNARPNDDSEPSDIDVILYVRRYSHENEPEPTARERFIRAKSRQAQLLRERTGYKFDIKLDTRDLKKHIADTDWAGYSLIERKAFNRPGDTPRPIKGWFFEDVFYVFDRSEHRRFLRAHGNKRLGMEVRDHCLVIFEQGKPTVELLRSRPKHAPE